MSDLPAWRQGDLPHAPAYNPINLVRVIGPGAILLGLRGVAVVGHGSSGALGIANQIRLAARSVEERTVARTEELIERSGVGRSAIRGGADGGS